MTQLLPSELLAEARKVIDACREAGLKIVTVESCTGGLLAGALTSIAGSSDVVERGFVTYSNAAKAECLGVPLPTSRIPGRERAAGERPSWKNAAF